MAEPQLSVVVASCVGSPFIDRCLQSLEKQRAGDRVEFIVIDRAGGEVAAHVERDFPWVELIRRPPGESVPDLRRHGIAAARAAHVAIIEEHCVAAHDWIAVLLRCIREPYAAVGGPVHDSDFARVMDWAVYFTEYNSYMPPVERGAATDVCAANCLYRRDLLLRHLPDAGSGYWEAALNQKLLSSGERFLCEPSLIVQHTGPFGFSYYLRQRFLFSRAFAGVRREHVSPAKRAAYLVLAPALMFLLLGRTAARVYAKRQRPGKLLLALPYLLPINAVYVLGEWVGYLRGPGDSLSKIE